MIILSKIKILWIANAIIESQSHPKKFRYRDRSGPILSKSFKICCCKKRFTIFATLVWSEFSSKTYLMPSERHPRSWIFDFWNKIHFSTKSLGKLLWSKSVQNFGDNIVDKKGVFFLEWSSRLEIIKQSWRSTYFYV